MMKSIKKPISVLLTFVMVIGMFAVIRVSSVAADVSTWAGLQSAVAAATTATLSLTQDIIAGESDQAITIAEAQHITLDLCGHTLSRNMSTVDDNGNVFKVSEGGKLSVIDSGGADAGTITGGYSKNGGAVYNEGTFEMCGGTIEDNMATENGGALYNKGTATITGGCLTKNVAADGGAIYNAAEATLSISADASVIENKTTYHGGGGISNHGSLYISERVQMHNNFAYTRGGAVWTGSNAHCTITGGSFTENHAVIAGSGIYVGGAFSIQGDPVVKNNSGDDLYLPNGKTIQVTGAFSSTAQIGVAAQSGGAVVTSGYAAHNAAAPTDYFFENGADEVADVALNGGEVKLQTAGLPCTGRYWDREEEMVRRMLWHLTDYTVLTDSTTAFGSALWYVVTGNITINTRLPVFGKKNILLCDGATLTMPQGIRVASGDLNIYGQAEQSGKLVCGITDKNVASIGGNKSESGGTIHIYGGEVNATSSTKAGQMVSESAGIGGGNYGASGNITIYGGSVTATGAVGIGSGNYAPDMDSTNAVEIYGGEVNAYPGVQGAAIGGGMHTSNPRIGIYGGRIKALATGGAGIGSGQGASQKADIEIANCYVRAEGTYGAGIGGGREGNGGTITITNSNVEATCYEDSIAHISGGYGAGIGGGQEGNGGIVTIRGSVVGASSKKGAGIGGGEGGSSQTTLIEDSCVVSRGCGGGAGIGGADGQSGGNITIRRSNVVALAKNEKSDTGYYKYIQRGFYNVTVSCMMNYSYGSVAFFTAGTLLTQFMFMLFAPNHSGAAIGGGDSGNSGTILIEESMINATSGDYSAAIGGGDDGSAENVTIKNSTVSATAGKYGAGIGSGDEAESNGNITIIDSTVNATGGDEGAGIGGGNQTAGGTITITGSHITAAGGKEYGAGIGGGDKGDSGNISITDSTVSASGGAYAAGIGSGDEAKNVGTITLTGSTVTATGGDEGAGVGGGNDVSNGTINISDTKLTATGGPYAAGIGGGDDGDGGTINIREYSVVDATGGKDAAGIGGGEDGDGGTVEIRNSTVTASGNHYGAGIGCGEDGDSATVRIFGRSTVTATSGGSGYAEAIGQGDYVISTPFVQSYLDDGLVVHAGSNAATAQRYTGTERYEAMWNSKYANIHPCEHPNVKWCYDNSSFHIQRCTECNMPVGDFQAHEWDAENICTVCGGSAVMCTLTLIEKNSAGEEVINEIDVPKYTQYPLPECVNAPENTVFIGWTDDERTYDAGTPYQVTGDTLHAAYATLVEADYVDMRGVSRTVQARQLSTDINYLPAGWYVADEDLNYSDVGKDITLNGTVNLILADGVRVTLNNRGGNSLKAHNSLTSLYLYGQDEQSGVMHSEGSVIYLADLYQYGGNIDSLNTVRTFNTTIARGTFTANNFSASYGFNITGGNVKSGSTASAVANTIGWSASADSVQFNTLTFVGEKGSLSVAEGEAFTDGSNIYTGTLTAEQIAALQGKKLTPYSIHHFGEPEWEWSEDYEHATAVFTCIDCQYQERVDATVEPQEDGRTFIATVSFNETQYSDTQSLPHNNGYFLTLDNTIGVNFLIDAASYGAEDGYIVYNYVASTTDGSAARVDVTQQMSELPIYKAFSAGEESFSGTHKLSLVAAPAQLAEQYIIEIYSKDGTLQDSLTASIAGYCEAMLEDETYGELMSALLNYGQLANEYFEYYTKVEGDYEVPHSDDYKAALSEAETTELKEASVTRLAQGKAVVEGVSYIARIDPEFKFYFSNTSATKAIVSNGLQAKVTKTDNGIAVKVTGLYANNFATPFTVTVDGTTITFNGYGYIKNALKDDSLKALAQGLFRYARAAEKVFD